ncbi:unnamed protein product [Closterium sp. NIES-54]
MKSAGNESESRDDRFPGQFFFVSTQAPAGPENDGSFEEPAAVGKVTLHSLDYWVIDSGATYSMTPRADLLTELEPSPVKHVTSALGQRAEVKGMGKAMFKGADGKMVGLKNVLWVLNLAANLISVVKEKVEYKELFAPVVKPTTLSTLLAGAAIKGWVVKQMDVTTAFLNGVLEEEIFMAQPEGFDDGSGRVLRLKKTLNGLKQSPRQWYLKL